MDLFKLQAEISVDIDKAVKNLTTIGTKVNQLGNNFEKTIDKKTTVDINTNKAEKELSDLNKQADKLDDNLNKVDDASRKASGGFTVLKGTVANLLAAGLQKLVQVTSQLIGGATQYQSSLEQYTTSFEVMTGSAEKAVEVTERLGEIAASTPFEMTTLADTTQLLMNYGFQADDAITKMTMLGDIAQGSSEKMNRIAMAYGQMSSAGKVSLEDVKQMIEAGFNPLQEISQTTGESMASLYDRISKGTISVDEITASMERSTAEGGKYFGSMDKQSQTLSGRLATLKDTINSSLGVALSGILTKLADVILPKITAAMEKVDWEAVGNKLSEAFDKLIVVGTWIIDNFDLIATLVIAAGSAFAAFKIVTTITTIINGFKTAMIALNVVMTANPIGLIIAAIAALVAAFIYLWNNVDGFKQFWIDAWDGAVRSFKNAGEKIKQGFNTVVNYFKDKINQIKKMFDITLKFKGIKTPKISIEWSQTPKWMAEAAKFLGMKGIPEFNVRWNAEGAIFKEPTIFNTPNGLQGVGDARSPEAVVPIDKLQGYVTTAVKEEVSGMEYNISRIYEIMTVFFPQFKEGMDRPIAWDVVGTAKALVPAIDKELGNLLVRKERSR